MDHMRPTKEGLTMIKFIPREALDAMLTPLIGICQRGLLMLKAVARDADAFSRAAVALAVSVLMVGFSN